MVLEETVADIQGKIRGGGLPNEYAVTTGAVLPMLGALDWPATNPLIVYPQYQVEGRFVDFALRNPIGKNALVFLEVKKVGGLSPKGEEQLFDYAYKGGVPLLVFTDGQEWDFYLPTGQGPSYEERQIYSLDLLKVDISECCTRLRRYLSYGDVLQGIAAQNAWVDYQEVLRQRQIEQTLPLAWQRLLDETDASVVDALAKKVTEICGYSPNQRTCIAFLSTVPRVVSGQKLPQQTQPPLQPRKPSEPVKPAPSQPNPPNTGVGFILRDEWHPCPSAIQVMVGVLEKLSELDPTFPDKFAAKDTRKSRSFIARSKDGLYQTAHLREKFSVESNFGWFIGTNYDKPSIVNAIKLACETAELKFGQDLIIQLG